VNHKRLLLLLGVSCLTGTGCKRESATATVPADGTSENAAAKLEKAKQQTREAVDATTEYAFAQRVEYAAKLRQELAAFNQELDELSTRIELSSASAKEEAKARLQELRNQIGRLNSNLQGVDGATESTWDEVKVRAKRGYDEMKESLKQSRQWLREKVSP